MENGGRLGHVWGWRIGKLDLGLKVWHSVLKNKKYFSYLVIFFVIGNEPLSNFQTKPNQTNWKNTLFVGEAVPFQQNTLYKID